MISLAIKSYTTTLNRFGDSGLCNLFMYAILHIHNAAGLIVKTHHDLKVKLLETVIKIMTVCRSLIQTGSSFEKCFFFATRNMFVAESLKLGQTFGAFNLTSIFSYNNGRSSFKALHIFLPHIYYT
jgi:hypothetical protein